MTVNATGTHAAEPACQAREGDRIRTARAAALARRAAMHEGPLRVLLEARIAELAPVRGLADISGTSAGGLAASRGPSMLSTLLDHLAGTVPASETTSPTLDMHAARPSTEAMEDVLRLCSQARAESRLRRTLVEPPADAGPLNSSALVHRALQLMQAASPGYLEAVLAHAEALAWIEDMQLEGAIAGQAAGPAAAPRRLPGKPAPRSRGARTRRTPGG